MERLLADFRRERPERLDPRRFVRVSRTAMVNVDRVAELKRGRTAIG